MWGKSPVTTFRDGSVAILKIMEHKLFLRMKHLEWAARYFLGKRQYIEHQVCESKMSEAAHWLVKIQKAKEEF